MKRPAIRFEHVTAGIALLAVSFLCVSLPLIVRSGQQALIRQTTESLAQSTAAVDAAMLKVGKTADAATALLNQSTATMKTVQAQAQRVGNDSHAEAVQISAVTRQAAGLASEATQTIQTANRTIQGFQPVEGATTRELRALQATTQTLNRQIGNPAIGETLANVQQVTDNAARITFDASRVSDKMTSDYLAPVPWWKWPLKRFGETWDIVSAIARNAP